MKFFDRVMLAVTMALLAGLASTPAQAFPTLHVEFVTPNAVIGPHDSVDIQVRLTVDQDFVTQRGASLHPSIQLSDVLPQYDSPNWKATYLFPGLVVQWEGGPAMEWVYDPDLENEPIFNIHKWINADTAVVPAGTYTFNLMTNAPRVYAPDGTYDFGLVSLNVFAKLQNVVTGAFSYEVVSIGRTAGNLTRTVSSVPEPSTTWLMLLGCAGVVLCVRQRG